MDCGHGMKENGTSLEMTTGLMNRVLTFFFLLCTEHFQDLDMNVDHDHLLKLHSKKEDDPVLFIFSLLNRGTMKFWDVLHEVNMKGVARRSLIMP